ncbi:GntR family transcriptional regulator [Actinopolymorpha alba]|uniref:GntR family transcriptional regulator n=1 Tax=Actinopolymorpha alba TaxID=533267 RepID=UPI00035D6573|nr:GntR family transcriptional regulator [Actinopolymorpha alba]
MPASPSPAGRLGDLDRNSPVPLYHQLERAFLRLIADDNLVPGSRFPSETELCARFEVTRPTVRQALERLVRVGVLRKERGRGTYVANVPEPDPGPTAVLTVKVVMPSLNELIHLQVLSGIVDQAHDDGLQVVLAHSDGRRAAQERELDRADGLAGVLLWPISASPRRSKALQHLRDRGIPVVFVDRYLDERSDHVVVDDESGGRQVTEHLTGLGHRRIAFVHAESATLSSVRLRRNGYRQALQSAGLLIDDALVLRLPESGSYDVLVAHLLGLPDPPTAAFCVNDVVAVGLAAAFARRGIDVPSGFSVAGFDALERLPSGGTITSVRRATDELGREAIRLLAGRLRSQGVDDQPRHVTLPTTLVTGDTTGTPPIAPQAPTGRRDPARSRGHAG